MKIPSSKWTEKAHEKWRVIRAKGRMRFILLHGVLGWGLPMFILMAVVPRWLGLPFNWEKYLLVGIILFPAGGAGFGGALWNACENQFRKHESKK